MDPVSGVQSIEVIGKYWPLHSTRSPKILHMQTEESAIKISRLWRALMKFKNSSHSFHLSIFGRVVYTQITGEDVRSKDTIIWVGYWRDPNSLK